MTSTRYADLELNALRAYAVLKRQKIAEEVRAGLRLSLSRTQNVHPNTIDDDADLILPNLPPDRKTP